MDYNEGGIHFYPIETKKQSYEIDFEDFITNRLGFNLDEISYMVSIGNVKTINHIVYNI